jgi:hypothetical protein
VTQALTHLPVPVGRGARATDLDAAQRAAAALLDELLQEPQRS